MRKTATDYLLSIFTITEPNAMKIVSQQIVEYLMKKKYIEHSTPIFPEYTEKEYKLTEKGIKRVMKLSEVE